MNDHSDQAQIWKLQLGSWKHQAGASELGNTVFQVVKNFGFKNPNGFTTMTSFQLKAVGYLQPKS